LHRTVCGVVETRYQNTAELIAKLDEIIALSNPKEPYLKTSLPAVSGFFTGREKEIQEIHDCLKENDIVFLSGIGGIGKSELAKHFAYQYEKEYDAIIFAPFVNDIQMMIADDIFVPICNFSQYPEEKPEEYFARKMRKLAELCDKRILMIVDNLDTTEDPNMDHLFRLGCKMLVTTRMDFSDVYPEMQLNLGVLENPLEVFHEYYKKPVSDEEQKSVDEIIDIVCGHTMTVELLAKQMMAGRVKPQKMLEKLKNGGISESGKEKVRTAKDGNLAMQNTYGHIQALFDLSELDEDEKYVLANLSLIPHTGISADLFGEWCEIEDFDTINKLAVQGWIRWDKERDYISLHTLISNILHNEHNIQDVQVLISRFSEYLTDDETGEVILKDIPFDFANIVATTIIELFCNKQLDPTEEAIHCIGKFGDFFFDQSLFELAEKSYHIQQEFYKILGLSNPYLLLVIYNNLALLYDKQGDLYDIEELSQKALHYFSECLVIVENSKNNLEEYLGTIYLNIGSVYHTLGSYENAEKYYKKAIKIDDSHSKYNLMGVLYNDLKKYNEALKMLNLAMEKAILCKAAPLTISVIEHNIGASYKGLTMYDKAIIHLKNSLKIKQNFYDSSYEIAMAKSLLGQVYILLGEKSNYNIAKQVLSEAMDIFRKIVGESNAEYQKAREYFYSIC